MKTNAASADAAMFHYVPSVRKRLALVVGAARLDMAEPNICRRHCACGVLLCSMATSHACFPTNTIMSETKGAGFSIRRGGGENRAYCGLSTLSLEALKLSSPLPASCCLLARPRIDIYDCTILDSWAATKTKTSLVTTSSNNNKRSEELAMAMERWNGEGAGLLPSPL